MASETWHHGCYRVYVAVTGFMWLLQGLCGCYGVYVPLFFLKIAVRGSFGTALRDGMTKVLQYTALLWQKEASDKSEISCKRAKCVRHLH